MLRAGRPYLDGTCRRPFRHGFGYSRIPYNIREQALLGRMVAAGLLSDGRFESSAGAICGHEVRNDMALPASQRSFCLSERAKQGFWS